MADKSLPKPSFFTELLRDAFEEYKDKYPNATTRIAYELNMGASHTGDMLAGRRYLGYERAKEIAKIMGLDIEVRLVPICSDDGEHPISKPE